MMKPDALSRVTRAISVALLVPFVGATACAQATATPRRATEVVAVRPPRHPLPPEAASAGVTRFAFVLYGDTRGRRDGEAVQYEHSLVVEAMLRTIKGMEQGPHPVRFIVQSGDAVVDGRDARQWNRSFTGLVNRLTTEAGLPYFLAPGNHDVTSAGALGDPGRKEGVGNYLAAMEQLIPPDGSTRRLAGYPTYAFGYGNTFFLALDSNIAEDAVQYDWARAQLEGLDRTRFPHVMVIFHHPVFSSGPHGGAIVERPAAVFREFWLPMFRRYRVNLLVTGHEHFYEHWVERYRDSTGVTRRMDQLVTGGGGAPLYAYHGNPDLRTYIAESGADSSRMEQLARPGRGARDNPYHFVVVHVDGDQMWLEVHGVDWGRGFAPYRTPSRGNRVSLTDGIP